MSRLGVSKLFLAFLITIIALVVVTALYITPRGTETSRGTETLVTTFTPERTVTVTVTTGAYTSPDTAPRTEPTPTLTTSPASMSPIPSSTGTMLTTLPASTTTTQTTSGTMPTLTITPYTTTTTQTARIASARLISPSRIWFSVELASKILEYDSSTGRVTPVYSDYPTPIGSFTPHPAVREKLYYVNPNDKKIYLAVRIRDSWNKEVAFEFDTYVRCYRFGPGLSSDPTGFSRAYFSTAWGAGGDGAIYLIVQNRADLLMNVRIGDVRGFWAGYFEFSPDGRLYLSSGNTVPGSIFEYRQGRFVEIARFDFPVMGMDYVSNARLALTEAPGGEVTVARGLLFANQRGSIYLHDLDRGITYLVFSDPSYGSNWITDVAVAP